MGPWLFRNSVINLVETIMIDQSALSARILFTTVTTVSLTNGFCCVRSLTPFRVSFRGCNMDHRTRSVVAKFSPVTLRSSGYATASSV